MIARTLADINELHMAVCGGDAVQIRALEDMTIGEYYAFLDSKIEYMKK